MKKIRILVVEDERIVAKDINNSLNNLGYEVTSVLSSGEEALIKVEEDKPDLILLDIVLKGELDGIETAKIIRSKYRIPIIYLTAYEDPNTLDRAKQTDPLGYILKPFEERDLNTTLEIALYKHKMELKLLESEERYRTLVELSPDGIIVVVNDKIKFINSSVTKLLNTSKNTKLLDRSITDFIDSDAYSQILTATNGDTDNTFIETKFRKMNGSFFEAEIISTSFSFEGEKAVQIILRDITDRKEAELKLKNAYTELKNTQQVLINTEKLAALGRFAAGVAHEIRNPLANISASAQLFASKYQIKDEMKNYLDVILRNADTANRIIKELLDFTSPREASMKEDDLCEILNHVCDLVNPRCKSANIYFNTNFKKNLLKLHLDRSKLEQTFMNFISNSIDAMPNGGKINITCKESDTKKDVIVIFEDSGSGIAPDDLNKIFEPFFTTKDHGTGLGLSLAYQIIKSHKGSIEITSELRKGTKIKITFPIYPTNY